MYAHQLAAYLSMNCDPSFRVRSESDLPQRCGQGHTGTPSAAERFARGQSAAHCDCCTRVCDALHQFENTHMQRVYALAATRQAVSNSSDSAACSKIRQHSSCVYVLLLPTQTADYG